MRRIGIAVAGLLVSALAARAQVPTPDQHLGRPLGQDSTLADWKEVASYYEKLAASSTLPSIDSSSITVTSSIFAPRITRHVSFAVRTP